MDSRTERDSRGWWHGQPYVDGGTGATSWLVARTRLTWTVARSAILVAGGTGAILVDSDAAGGDTLRSAERERVGVKHLPKHLQPRWRYLAVGIEAWPDARIGRDSFQRELWYSAQNLLGDTGSAELDLSVLRFQYREGQGEALVRTYRGEVERARAVLACLDSVGETAVGLRVRGVSGTIRACEEKYMGRRPEYRGERHVAFEDADRTAHIRADRADIRVDDAFAGATTLEL